MRTSPGAVTQLADGQQNRPHRSHTPHTFTSRGRTVGPAAQGLPHTCLLAPRPGRAWEAPSFGLLPASCRGGVKGTHRGTAARSERCAGPALPPALQLAPGAEGGSPCPFHDGTQSSTAETLWPRVSRVTPSLPGGHPPPAVTVPPSSATRQRAAGQGCVGREHGGTPAPGPCSSGAGCPGAPLPTAQGLGLGVPSRGRQPLLWSGPRRPPKDMSGPQAPRGSGETPVQMGAPGLGVAASRGRGSCRVFSLEGWGTVGTRPHMVLPRPHCILKSPEVVKDFNTCCWLRKESFNKGAPEWLRRLSI